MTGLQFAQPRYYLAEVGRFISEDPMRGQIIDPESLNRYVYCKNNTFMYIDPTGFAWMPKWRKNTFGSCKIEEECNNNVSNDLKYETKALMPIFEGEEQGICPFFPDQKVKYLTSEERKNYQLTIKDGKLYNFEGNLFDTSDATSLHSKGKGKAIFVMDEKGNIYSSLYQERGKFHHSSFLAGKPVAAAGEIEAEKGVIKSVSRQSGHYRPGEQHSKQFYQELENKGVDTSNIIDEGGFF